MKRPYSNKPKGKSPRRPEKNARLTDLKAASEFQVFVPDNADELKQARVLCNYGIECEVLLDGEVIRISNDRHLKPVTCDIVYTDGRYVLGIAARGKVLSRYLEGVGIKILAAHLEQVGLVVSASEPIFQEGFADRYLVYCRIVNLPMFIVVNKIDEMKEGFEKRLEPYQAAGVEVYYTSALDQTGLEKLTEKLGRGISILSGLSGVGKSSLINQLLSLDIATQEVSETSSRGKHTTTSTMAYDFNGTFLIDSPGIRKFGLIGIEKHEVLKGFPELEPYAKECRFDDCLHNSESGCAVREAAMSGQVDKRRYNAYVELLESAE